MAPLGLSLFFFIQTVNTEIESVRSLQWESKALELESENKKLRAQAEELSKLLKNSTCIPHSKEDTPSTKDFLPTLQKKVQKLPAPRMKSEEKSLYEKALQAVEAENWDEALLRMEHFVKYFPDSPMADNAIFWMAQIYLQKNETELARAELIRLQQTYPQSDRLPQAQLLLKDLPQVRGGTP